METVGDEKPNVYAAASDIEMGADARADSGDLGCPVRAVRNPE